MLSRFKKICPIQCIVLVFVYNCNLFSKNMRDLNQVILVTHWHKFCLLLLTHVLVVSAMIW